MKKRVRLYKAQMGGYAAAQQMAAQQNEVQITDDQLMEAVSDLMNQGENSEAVFEKLIQSGIDPMRSRRIVDDVEASLEEDTAAQMAKISQDQEAQEEMRAQEEADLEEAAAAEREAQKERYEQMYYADSNADDGSEDEEDFMMDNLMRYGGKVPSKRTFVKNVMNLTKKQLGGEETKDKNLADGTDTGQRENRLKAFVGSLQGNANNALMKEDAEAMYGQYFQDGGDTESGMMAFDPYHNLAHYSDTFEHAMPEDMTSMMKAQDGGMSPGQARRMQRRTDRMIRNIPVGYSYGASMFPQGVNILNIAQPQMMASRSASPLSNYMSGVRMANIDVRRVGLFGRPKEYTINFANDVANNPQLQKEMMEQEARNTRQTVKDITDAGYTTTVTDSGIKGSSSTVPTEGQATDFFKKDDNKNNIPDYLEVTGGPNDMGTTPTTATGTGGGGSRTGGGGSGSGGNNFTETEEELVLDEETGAYVPASMKAAAFQHFNQQEYFDPLGLPEEDGPHNHVIGNYIFPSWEGMHRSILNRAGHAPNIFTLSDKKGYYYKFANDGKGLEKYKGSPSQWTSSAKPVATIEDQSTINYVIDKGKAYTPTKPKQESNFPTLTEWLKSKGYPNSPKYVQQYNIERNSSKELTAAKSSGASLAKTFGSTTPPTKQNSTPVKEYTKNGIKVQVYTKYQTDAQTGEKFPIKIVKRFDSKGKLLDNSYVEFSPYADYGKTKIPYNQYFGKKQQGGVISNPFEDSYGNLQKFIYGGGDDISIPQVAGKLTDDAYFQYGGLTEYQDKGQVTAGAEPKAGQKKADWEKASGYSSTGEGGDLVWNGKSWVKAADYKPATTSSNTSTTTTSNTSTTTNPKTTTTTNTNMFPGQVAPIYPPLFGGGLFRGLLGANALRANPFASYAGTWTQQRGQAFDPATGKPIDITGMENTPLSRIQVDKVGLLSGRPKKYTMYFGEPVAEGTSATGSAAATSQETRDEKGKRKMAPGLEKVLLKIPGMSRVLYPYGDEEEAPVTPAAVQQPVNEDDELANLYWGHPTLNTGNVKNQNITMPIKPSSEMRLETSYDREKAAMGEGPITMPIRPSSGMQIPTSMDEQELMGQYGAEEIGSLPLRNPGFIDNLRNTTELAQFIPQEEDVVEEDVRTVRSQKPPKPMTRRQEKKWLRSLPYADPAEVFGYDNTIVPQEEGFPGEQQALPEEMIDREALMQSMGLNEDQFNQMQQEYDVYRPMFNQANQNFLNTMEGLTPDYNESLQPLSVQYKPPVPPRPVQSKPTSSKTGSNTTKQVFTKKSTGNTNPFGKPILHTNTKEEVDAVKMAKLNQKTPTNFTTKDLQKIQDAFRNSGPSTWQQYELARRKIESKFGPKKLQQYLALPPNKKMLSINKATGEMKRYLILLAEGFYKEGGELRKAQIGQANNYTTNPDMIGLSDIDLVSSETAPISGMPSSMSTWPSQMPARYNQQKDPTMLSLDPNQMNRQTQKKQFDLGFQPGPGVDFSTGEFPEINPNNYGYAFEPGEGVDFATGEFPEIKEDQPATETQTPGANNKGFAVKFKNKNMYNIDPRMGLNVFNKFANAGLQGLENQEAKRQERENNKQLIGDNLYGSTNIMSRGTYNVNSGLLDESTMGSVGVVKYGGYLQDGGYVIDEESMYDIAPIEGNWMDGSRLQDLYMNQNYMNASPEYLNSMISQGVADEEEGEEFAEGGVTYMSEDQIRKFMQEGGELEFV